MSPHETEDGDIQFERRNARVWSTYERAMRVKIHDCLYEDNQGTYWPICGLALTGNYNEEVEDTAEAITCKNCLRTTPKTVERRAREALQDLTG
mgnify:CR=1 FL=1